MTSLRYGLLKVNVIGRCEDFLPSKKLSELEVNNIYVISDIKSVKAKYGNTIIVSIDNEFSVFLPTRVAEILLDDPKLLEDMIQNAKENHMGLNYLGGNKI
ncbi:hypothetical protein KQX54_014407 [Cotesia glomerata]|uniref:Uncharacterized protein n=1 Tax=Cotesia glomerata TaxID=32391 RepID=A0AAV7J7L7_COTGL|nr:hypothetical protein KQX54_014407 [Cotesia glomerata]